MGQTRDCEDRLFEGKFDAHIHQGDITGEQADQLRALLRGHKIDAAEALSLHPEDFFDRNGELDGGAVLWWLDSINGKYVG